ncbi:BadF/BadG/BcrA/BcrD ATPase family protein [Paenibacillus sp. FSL M8-0334]|uniref:ATPase n=1 Tax=Paenibacillus campinasensis TaxID=66347 RepID=A0ABW9T2B8_9BACL|nr:BadF/BadG/BcrA/BcrD ATPase family protein [Paenibacillus campinasensis]MUG67440.1 ATPase [Paenibacillus campinasensis]
MAYVIGIDGGGTKTAVAIASDQGELIEQFHVGAINYNGGDAETIAASFQEMFDRIKACCGSSGPIQQIVIGAAGISNPQVSIKLEHSVRRQGYEGALRITGDQETALYGAHNAMQGIILIAGTGSICFGVNAKGEKHRSGGFGHLIDDEGSGYSIGRQLLSVLVQAEDGRLSDTVIPAMVYKQLGLHTVQEIIGFVYSKETTKKNIAALAPIMTTACEQGDEQALRIAKRCADSLHELLVPVIEKLGLQDSPIAVAGSVLQQSPFVQEALANKLKETYPSTRLILPMKNAAYGAVLMACKLLRERSTCATRTSWAADGR